MASDTLASSEPPIAGVEAFSHRITEHRHVNYQTDFSLLELIGFSSATVTGSIIELIEGGIAGGNSTSVAVVEVDEVVSGVVGDLVYVELVHAPVVSTESLVEVLPVESGLWILEIALEGSSSPLDKDRGKGVPAGEPYYAPVSPQGLVMEHPSASLWQPLEPDVTLWLSELEGAATIPLLLERLDR